MEHTCDGSYSLFWKAYDVRDHFKKWGNAPELFICDLFNDASIDSGYAHIASNGRVINEWWTGTYI
jgi:hypothetical protein